MAQYGKSWGSVSSDFRRTTGFQSETKRISQQAEDQFRKEKDQLSSMKEVAAFDSKQMRSSAAMADKASQYELKALSKFSSKLNTFLQGTAAEMYKEHKAKDIKKRVKRIKKERVEFAKKVGELPSQIDFLNSKENIDKLKLEGSVNAIAENTTKVNELQEQLDAHNLTDPNDPKKVQKLSGNEKIAYYSITAAEKVKGAKQGYFNYIDEQADSTRVAKWLPKVKKTVNGQEREVWQTIKVGAITTPEGKAFLKEEYWQKVMEDPSSQMGGLKDDYVAALLGDPLQSELDAIQAKEDQDWIKDHHDKLWDAANTSTANAIAGVPPYDSVEIIENKDGSKTERRVGLEKHINAQLSAARRNYTGAGHGTARDGFDKMMSNALDVVLNKTNKDDMAKAWDNYKAIGDVMITTGPNKGKKFKDAFPNRWNEETLKKDTIEMAKKRDLVDALDAKVVKGRVESDVDAWESKMAEKKAQQGKAWTPEKAQVESDEFFGNLYKTYENSPTAGAIIYAMQGKSEVAYGDSEWELKFRQLGTDGRGIVLTKDITGMPTNLVNELKKKYNWRVEDQKPAYKTALIQGTTERDLNKFEEQILIRQAVNGQTKSDNYTEAAIDYAGDEYEKRVNAYVLDGDHNGRKLPIDQAQTLAKQEVLAMIGGGPTIKNSSGTEIPNPLFPKRDDSIEGKPSAWRSNEALAKHMARGNRLVMGPMEKQWTSAQYNYQTASEKGKVDLKKTYIFTPIATYEEGNKEGKPPGTVKDIDSLKKLLGDGLEVGAGTVVSEAYKRVNRKEASTRRVFLHKQRIAALSSTSPSGDPMESTLWQTHPELLQAWFTNEEEGTLIGNVLQSRDTYEGGQGLIADYGGKGGWMEPTLSRKDAEAMYSGEGRETVFKPGNVRGGRRRK